MTDISIDPAMVAAYRIQSGKVNKPAPGTVRVVFNNPFVDIPNVVLTPHWENAGHVGFIETLTVVRPDYFEFTSPNAAGNYYVQWMSLGRSA